MIRLSRARLTRCQNDIEALIERSFLMKENNFRRLHRQLQWHYKSNSETPRATYENNHERSQTSKVSVSVSGSYSTCEGSDTEAGSEDSLTDPEVGELNIRDLDQFRLPGSEGSVHSTRSRNSEDGNMPTLNRDDTSINSPSVASCSSKSTNPFRRHMEHPKRRISLGGSLQGMAQSIWDDPTLF